MDTMAKKQPRPRKSFTPEFKAKVVELIRPGSASRYASKRRDNFDRLVADLDALTPGRARSLR
jgi:transposase